MASMHTVVLLEPRAGDLITDVCSRARDAHDDAIADAVTELFEALAGKLLETREGVRPVTLGLTPLATRVLTRTLHALERHSDIGRAATLQLIRLQRYTVGLDPARGDERAAA